MVDGLGRLLLMMTVISGPCETVFLASLVTRPQGDGGGAIFAPQGDGGGVAQNPVGVTETTQKVRPLMSLRLRAR